MADNTNPTVWLGRAYPLGATVTPEGTNFAIFSQHATGVELCLFNGPDDTEHQLGSR